MLDSLTSMQRQFEIFSVNFEHVKESSNRAISSEGITVNQCGEEVT